MNLIHNGVIGAVEKPAPSVDRSSMELAKQAGRHNLRIPFRLQMLFGSRRFFSVFALGMAVFSLYGPIPARAADHNGYRYVLGPLVTAVVGLVLTLLFPYNPYSGRSEPSLKNLNQRDEDARRLVEIIRSAEYRRTAVVAAGQFALIVSVIMLCFAAMLYRSLSWTLKSPWMVEGVGGGLLFAWLFIKIRSISWALMEWWNEAGRPNAPIE